MVLAQDIVQWGLESDWWSEMLSGLKRTCDDIAGGQPVFGHQDSLHIVFEYEKESLNIINNFEI